MTKRLLALVLVCILAIPIFAVPASAAGITGDVEYDNWYNTYFIASYIELIADVYLTLISDMLDSIDGWCDTLWQEIRNSSLWLQTTLWEALDTMNSNLIALANNLSLYTQIIVQTLDDWFTAVYEQFDAFVQVFFSFWESIDLWFSDVWTEINEFKLNAIEYLRQLVNGSWERENEADRFGEQASTEATEFEENMDIIQDWTKPDFEAEFDPSVEGIVGEDVDLYSVALYGVFDSANGLFVSLLFMAFSFSAISFVVFGKR